MSMLGCVYTLSCDLTVTICVTLVAKIHSLIDSTHDSVVIFDSDKLAFVISLGLPLTRRYRRISAAPIRWTISMMMVNSQFLSSHRLSAIVLCRPCFLEENLLPEVRDGCPNL